MLDSVRRYVEAGREALTPAKAQELARSLVEQGQARGEQVAKLARDLLDWSRKSSERFLETIRGEVKKQVSRAGLATKGDLEALKKRIRKLETASGPRTRSGTAAKKGTGSREA